MLSKVRTGQNTQPMRNDFLLSNQHSRSKGMKTVALICILLSSACKNVIGQNKGKFWHISDHHLDPYYNEYASDESNVCPSSYGYPISNAGPWGNHRCDSPWRLINSSVYAMAALEGNPDFIVWTGDDTLHTGDQAKYLGEEKVIEIIGNITMLLKSVFPNTTFYSALGNHDYHPKSQIPPGNSSLLSAIANLWEDWMTVEAYTHFDQHGYYAETFGDNNQHLLITLNSNLWYHSNKVVDGLTDPDNQFQWLEDTLKTSRNQSQKVFIIGHVPPGYFELINDTLWYYEHYNVRYNAIVTTYHDVIAGQFFGHHHTDTFRLFKDKNGEIVSSMLLTPGVTPWMTTLPGVENGANNPGIRLYEYDKDTLHLIDYTQYYLNLIQANNQTRDAVNLWEKEYSATDAFGISDVSTDSLDKLATEMRKCESCECPEVFHKYFLYNSVSYNADPCDSDSCQRDQLCAISSVEKDSHDECIKKWGSGTTQLRPKFLVLFVSSIFAFTLVSLFSVMNYST